MRIKLALLDNDERYINKIASALNSKYNQDIELYVFTDPDIMNRTIDLNSINVFITNPSLYNLDTISNKNIGLAYFTDSADIISVKGHKVIHKFQKLEKIYNSIKLMYEEVYEVEVDKEINNLSNCTQFVVYTSFSGGTGTSIVAMSDAITKAKIGKKVLYLNLEYFDTTELCFHSSETSATFGDVIYSIKKKTKNLELKLESLISRDNETCVFFIKKSNVLLDKLEIFNVNDLTVLFDALENMNFDYVVVDRNINFSLEEQYIFSRVSKIRFVVDGSEISNQKFLGLMNALPLLDDRNKTNYCSKIEIVYNKMSTSSNNRIKGENIKIIASINKYKTNKDIDIVHEIVKRQYLLNI